MNALRRSRLLVGALAGLMLLCLLVGGLALAQRLRDAAEAAAQQTVARVSRVAASSVNRHFLQVDGALAGLPSFIGQLGQGAAGAPIQPAAVNALLQQLNFQNLSYRDLLLVDAAGRPWASALAASRRRALPVDPAEFAEAPRVGAVAIAGPARNPATGEWSLFFARPLELRDVGPLYAVAEVPVALISTLLESIGAVPGIRILLERTNGELLASLPHNENRIGSMLMPPASDRPTDGTTVQGPGRLGELAAVISSTRETLYRDILITVDYDRAVAFAGWQRDKRNMALIGLGAAGLLLALAATLIVALRQRERREAEGERARRVLDSAIESMSDGFVMFDAEDRLVAFNQRYQDLYSVSAPFIKIGASFQDIIRGGALLGQYPQTGPDVEALVRELTAWHRGNHAPMERLLPDGRWVLITERLMPDGGVVGIRTDITVLKRAMAELAAATEAKSRFLARMSHELRTPLNGVLGLAQALARDPALGPTQHAAAELLEQAGRHLLAVANDILDLSRVEAGQLILQPEPVALQAVLAGCIAMQEPAATDKLIRLSFDADPALPPMVLADPTRLRQLFMNLLSNAIKFTPSGGQVRLLARRLEPDRAAGALPNDAPVPLRFEVRDTGPGVPPDSRDAIFGDFVQLKGGARSGGAGLGLAIAAHIVSRMQGRIGCDPNPDLARARPGDAGGPGACFWVEFALQPCQVPVAAEPAAEEASRHRSLRLLVVDDVPANLAVARALLESAGHEADCRSGGVAGVRAVAEAAAAGTPYDAVLMDVMMPEMDGLEAARRIRALPREVGQLPILALTAGVFAEDIVASQAAGMDLHLAKPIEREALRSALAAIAARTMRRQAA